MVPQAVVRGGGHRPCVPPSNLPPLGGGEESVHTAVDHNEGGSLGVSHLLHMAFLTGLYGFMMPTMMRAPRAVTPTPSSLAA